MTYGWRVSAWGAVAGALLLAAGGEALADRVHLRNGRILEGTVKHADAEKVIVEMRLGEVTVPRENVVKIDYEMTPLQAFEKAVQDAATADECLDAARQGQAAGVGAEHLEKAYKKAIRLEPSRREAHEALGHVEVNGRWLADDEAKREQGWVEVGGRLVPPEKAAEMRAQERDQQRALAGESLQRYLDELKGVPWGAVKPIETPHYIIKCNSSPAVAQRYADFMEKIYAAYDQVFKGYKRHYTGKSTIYIFRSVKDFWDYGGGQPGVGGFYMPASPNENLYPSRIVSAYHGTFGTTGDTREVLAHEGTHQFQHILCAGPPQKFLGRPAWWIEGLAVYFGDGYRFDKKGALEIGIPRDRLMTLQRYLKGGKVMPMSQFVRMPYRQFSMMAGISYPYSWAMCHYFLHRGEEVQGRGPKAKKVQKLVDIGGKKIDLAKSFREFFEFVLAEPPDSHMRSGYEEYYASKLQEILGVSLDDLMEDWKAYVLGLELERLGEVSRDQTRYTSHELAFEVARPSGFEWREDDTQGREAIRLENPSSSALVIIAAQGNMDNSPLEELATNAEDGIYQKLTSPFLDHDKRRQIEVAGFEAIDMYYEGEEAAVSANTGREIKRREGEQRFRHVIVSTVRRSYEIVMQSDYDRFDDNAEAFEALVRSFRILD